MNPDVLKGFSDELLKLAGVGDKVVAGLGMAAASIGHGMLLRRFAR